MVVGTCIRSTIDGKRLPMAGDVWRKADYIGCLPLEHPFQPRKLFFDFLVILRVLGDDGAEVTTEHAFGGDQGVKGLGW